MLIKRKLIGYNKGNSAHVLTLRRIVDFILLIHICLIEKNNVISTFKAQYFDIIKLFESIRKFLYF